MFELVEVRTVSLDLKDPPAALRPLLEAHPHTSRSVAELPSVAQLGLLRRLEDGRQLLLANTHLYYANPAVHVRLMQCAAMLHSAQCWATELSRSSSKPGSGHSLPPIVLAGDLNADSSDAAVQLLSEGRVAHSHPDWMRGQLYWSGGLGIDGPRSTSREGHQASQSAETGAATAECESEGQPHAATLDSARSLARRFHRLRIAARRLVQEGWLIPTATAGGGQHETSRDLSQVLSTAEQDAAAGRNARTSTALAAIQVADECGLSIDALGAAEAPIVVRASTARARMHVMHCLRSSNHP